MILFFIIQIFYNLRAQPLNAIGQLPDSLLKEIAKVDKKESIDLINHYCYINRGKFHQNFGISLMLYNYNDAKQISYINGQAFAMGNFMYNFYRKIYSTGEGLEDNWRPYIKEAYSLLNKTTDTLSRFVLTEGIGFIHYAVMEYGDGFKFLFKALDLAEKLSEYRKIIHIYSHICYSYRFLNDHYAAIEYSQKGIDIARKHGLNISGLVRYSADSYIEEKEYDKLLPLLKIAIKETNEEKGNEYLRGMFDFYAWTAKCFWKSGKQDSAEKYVNMMYGIITFTFKLS